MEHLGVGQKVALTKLSLDGAGVVLAGATRLRSKFQLQLRGDRPSHSIYGYNS